MKEESYKEKYFEMKGKILALEAELKTYRDREDNNYYTAQENHLKLKSLLISVLEK